MERGYLQELRGNEPAVMDLPSSGLLADTPSSCQVYPILSVASATVERMSCATVDHLVSPKSIYLTLCL